jgi:hypothetical protein
MKWALALALAVSVPSSFAADVVNGNFHFGKAKFKPVDAIAYQVPGKDNKPLTIVAFSDFKIDRQGVLDAIHTEEAFFDQINKNEGGNFVMMRLTKPDRCGIYGLVNNGGNQIDLGDSFVSKASIGASRAAGHCATSAPGKMFDDVYDFDLTYDVPLMVIPDPAKLSAGGGEPGAVYASLVKAIRTADWNAANMHLRKEEVRNPKPAASEMREYFRGIGLNYPKTVAVTGGLMKGKRANLDITGTDRDDKKIHGVVVMKKDGADWRVVDQNFFFTQ